MVTLRKKTSGISIVLVLTSTYHLFVGMNNSKKIDNTIQIIEMNLCLNFNRFITLQINVLFLFKKINMWKIICGPSLGL